MPDFWIMDLYVTLDLVSPPAQEKFKVCKWVFLIFQSTQHSWCHQKADQQGINFSATWKFSSWDHCFLAWSLVADARSLMGPAWCPRGAVTHAQPSLQGQLGGSSCSWARAGPFCCCPRIPLLWEVSPRAGLAGSIRKQSQRAVKLGP